MAQAGQARPGGLGLGAQALAQRRIQRQVMFLNRRAIRMQADQAERRGGGVHIAEQATEEVLLLHGRFGLAGMRHQRAKRRGRRQLRRVFVQMLLDLVHQQIQRGVVADHVVPAQRK